MPGESLHAGLEQLSHLDGGMPHHLFSFGQTFFYLFDYGSHYRPIHARDILISCIESLALALECHPAPGRWLQRKFRNFGFFSGGFDPLKWVHCSGIQHEHATTLQRNVKRVETAIRTEVFCASFDFQRSFSLKVLYAGLKDPLKGRS